MLYIINPGTRPCIAFISGYKCLMLQTFKACVLFSAAPSFCMVSVGLDTWQEKCWRQGLSVSGALLKVHQAANPWSLGLLMYFGQTSWSTNTSPWHLAQCALFLFFINALEKVINHCKIFVNWAIPVLGRGRTRVCHCCMPSLLSAEGLWLQIPLFPAAPWASLALCWCCAYL